MLLESTPMQGTWDKTKWHYGINLHIGTESL